MERREQGLAGHFTGADRCLFKRATVIIGRTQKIIVSTVGDWMPNGVPAQIGSGRYYETMAFEAVQCPCGRPRCSLLVADITKEIEISSINTICQYDKPSIANEMHEKIVSEIMSKIK